MFPGCFVCGGGINCRVHVVFTESLQDGYTGDVWDY